MRVWMCGMHVNNNSCRQRKGKVDINIGVKQKKNKTDGQRLADEKLLWIFILKILSLLCSV